MTTLNCPTCNTLIKYDKSNAYRPFCSERCKLIDLGEWASGGHSIAGKSAAEEMFSEEVEAILAKVQNKP